jgi:Nucleotidyltransferase of unknown function (DUF6036)
MPDKRELPAPWPEFLSQIDRSLSKSVELRCVGGFVLTILYEAPRYTGDLDYITPVPSDASGEVEELAGEGSKLAKKYKVFFHFAGVVDLPANYEERLADLSLGLRLSKLSLKVLEPYDLVLSKLTRNSPKDREDVKYLGAKLKMSFRTLYKRFTTEMKPWVANPERHNLTLNVVWRDYFNE